MVVLVLRFPNQNITAAYTSALINLLGKMRALEAIQLVAATIESEVIEAIMLRTTVKYIQIGVHDPHNKTKMLHQCLYDRQGSALIATNHQWVFRYPRVPVQSVEYQISATQQFRVITSAWRRAQSTRFIFGIGANAERSFLLESFINDCTDLEYSNVYELADDDMHAEIHRVDGTYLAFDASRSITVALYAYCAIYYAQSLPRLSMGTTTASYGIRFADGLTAGRVNGAPVDFSKFKLLGASRVLEFDAKDLILEFFGHISDLLYLEQAYEGVEVISGLIDGTRTDWTLPTVNLANLRRLQFILLRGIGEIAHFALSADFDVEPTTKRCDDALGHTQPPPGAAMCLSVKAKVGPYWFGNECTRYDSVGNELFSTILLLH